MLRICFLLCLTASVQSFAAESKREQVNEIPGLTVEVAKTIPTAATDVMSRNYYTKIVDSQLGIVCYAIENASGKAATMSCLKY